MSSRDGASAGVARPTTSAVLSTPFKAGATSVDSEAYFGFGFDANWSWLQGKNDNVYVGIGFGLKRLFGTREGFIEFIPTIRIINIGVAF